MEINLLPKIEIKGRSGLSRTLGIRFSETTFLYTFMALAICSGFFVLMDVLLPLLKLQFKMLLAWSALFKVVFFAITAYISWVLVQTSSLRVHLHREQLIYEVKDLGAIPINFADIQSIRYGHQLGVWGFFLTLQSGITYHFPIHLERLDYILDTLHFHRPDLTQTQDFVKFRQRAITLDHVLAHNHNFLPRAHVKAISFYLLYPLYYKHAFEKIKHDPQSVSRDVIYEKKMETLARRINIGFSIVALLLVIIWKFKS